MALPNTQPLYVLPKQKGRAIVPKTATLLILGAIFYLGVLVNFSLLELTAEKEEIAKLSALFIIIALVGVGIINALRKANQPYYFYQDQIINSKTSISYQTITQIERKEKLSDKMFKTYSLTLNNQFKIKYISQQVNIQEYIEKMVSYATGRTGAINQRI